MKNHYNNLETYRRIIKTLLILLPITILSAVLLLTGDFIPSIPISVQLPFWALILITFIGCGIGILVILTTLIIGIICDYIFNKKTRK